jgi:hypothetical protein
MSHLVGLRLRTGKRFSGAVLEEVSSPDNTDDELTVHVPQRSSR